MARKSRPVFKSFGIARGRNGRFLNLYDTTTPKPIPTYRPE